MHTRAGHVNVGEVAASVEEAMSGTGAVAKDPNDLPTVVDAARTRIDCAGHVDLGEAAAVVEKAVDVVMPGGINITKGPDDLPLLLMPSTNVLPAAPGTSIWMKLPPV